MYLTVCKLCYACTLVHDIRKIPATNLTQSNVKWF